MPFLARWPGKVPAGAVAGHVGYFGDFLATAAALAGAPVPERLDSLSFVPTLLGKAAMQAKHDYLYWEFFERGFSQAVLLEGRWKGIRLQRRSAPLQLYDLATDLGEKANVADAQPEMVTRINGLMKTARVDSPLWPVVDPPAGAGGRKQE